MKRITVSDIVKGFRFDEFYHWYKEVVEVLKTSAKHVLCKVVENDGFTQYITFEVKDGIICDGNSMTYSHTTSLTDALYFWEIDNK